MCVWECGGRDVGIDNMHGCHDSTPTPTYSQTHIFREARRVLRPGGHLYLSELHPYRQLGGTQANFDHEASGENVTIVAFSHPVSEFVNEGLDAGFAVREMGE